MNPRRFDPSRRAFFPTAGSLFLAAAATPATLPAQTPLSLPDQLYTTEDPTHGKRRLFDGSPLRGWWAIPRLDPGPVLGEDDPTVTDLTARTLAHAQKRRRCWSTPVPGP
ncbi:MAG: hypothetical protein JNJ82_21565 [Opitutaceae bacterium]|nr:hypothetical protein [Opitutaceae bacterium]